MNGDHEIRERLLGVLAPVGLMMAAGTAGYRLIEGWPLFDSLYMTVITLATVGYGETHPLSHAGRVFTIGLILVGIGVLTYAFSSLTAFIVEGDLNDALRRRRMQTKIAKLAGHFIVCGGGHTGRIILEELEKTGREVVLIDEDPEVVQHLADKGVMALHGDATDDETLKAAGIERARGLFGALPTDPGNVFVAITARGLKADLRIVSRQQERGVEGKLKRSGADVAVDPGLIGGLRMASEMIRPAAVGFLDSMIRAEGKVFRIEEVPVVEGAPLIGEPLGTVKGSEGEAALVLAVRAKDGKTYDINPAPSRALAPGEVLVAMGSKEQLKELRSRLGVN
ncbi:MAG: potassium channel protein [Elusimicrobia bacterium]|nr:potassium channel protein [Elusimicrobiota bacterium]